MWVTAAIWLLFVAVSLRPPFRRGRPGLVVFVLTTTFTEVPLLLLGVFLVSIALAGEPGTSVMTVVTAALSFATTCGLVRLQLRAGTTRGALTEGLDHGLGRSWRTSHELSSLSGGLPPTPWSRGILLPFQRRVRGVEQITGLSYGPDPAHRVDVYRGPATRALRPVLIHLHGGGFVSGGRSRESRALLNRLAAHGWLCLSADYRLGESGRHPNPLVDTKRLIAWVRDGARDLGADASQLYLAGCSAGGHLALSAALTADEPALQVGFETVRTDVAGVLVLYGYLGPRTGDPSSSPGLLGRADAPPVLIVHGAHDSAVPLESVRNVAAVLRRTSRNPVVLVELPYTQHAFDRFASVRSRMAACAGEAFLDWVRTRGRQTLV